MQIIYSTPRLENAERIASLLEAGGVAVRLLYGPHFRRNTWKGANYPSTETGKWPRVMVLNNGDMPRGREILREAGILPPTAFDRLAGGAPDAPVFTRTPPPPSNPISAARIVRISLIIAVLVVGTVQFTRHIA